MKLLNIALGLSLAISPLALPVKAQYIWRAGSSMSVSDVNQRIARESPRQEEGRTNRFYRYCERPRLTMRAKQLKVERLYRYSIYCGRKVLHGWTFSQRGNRQSNRLRAYIYSRDGYLIDKRELSLRKYDGRSSSRRADLFVSLKVGSVTIERIKSNRGGYRYERRNREEYDDD